MIIDTHAHLYWESYKDDFDQVVERALEANLGAIINIGVDVETSQKALRPFDIAQGGQAQGKLGDLQNLSVYSSIGLHPHEALRYSQGKLSNVDVSIHEDVEELMQLYHFNTGKVVAVGECGLDYKFDTNDLHPDSILSSEQIKTLQRKLFQAQIDLAKKLNLPLLVHCRDDRSQNPQNSEAWDEVIKMTKEHFGIYHCYSGLPSTTNYLLRSTNFLISFAGNITYPKNDYLLATVKTTPLDRIAVETDCPFLPPQAYRGQRNEPSYITEVVKTIAQIKNCPAQEVEQQTTKNLSQIGLSF